MALVIDKTLLIHVQKTGGMAVRRALLPLAANRSGERRCG
jgi:hypothetical protein